MNYWINENSPSNFSDTFWLNLCFSFPTSGNIEGDDKYPCDIWPKIYITEGLVRTQSFKKRNFDIKNFFLWDKRWVIIKRHYKRDPKIHRGSICWVWLLPWELREKSTRKELRRRSCKAEVQTSNERVWLPLGHAAHHSGDEGACLENWKPPFLGWSLLMGTYCWTGRNAPSFWDPWKSLFPFGAWPCPSRTLEWLCLTVSQLAKYKHSLQTENKVGLKLGRYILISANVVSVFWFKPINRIVLI